MCTKHLHSVLFVHFAFSRLFIFLLSFHIQSFGLLNVLRFYCAEIIVLIDRKLLLALTLIIFLFFVIVLMLRRSGAGLFL